MHERKENIANVKLGLNEREKQPGGEHGQILLFSGLNGKIPETLTATDCILQRSLLGPRNHRMPGFYRTALNQLLVSLNKAHTASPQVFLAQLSCQGGFP